MTRTLKISRTLKLALDTFITGTQAILGKKRGGKSYKAAVQAEELLDAGEQIVIMDPTSAHWGLRSSADGRSQGFPIAIFGGEHADIPLQATGGEVLAEAIVSEGFSAIIDLSLFTKGEELRFAAAFLETLYRKNRKPMHLFIDEADVYAPQRTFGPEEAKALGACQSLVRRGGIKGIGVTMITQRPAVLNKDVLSQVDMVTCLKMNHPKDLGAIGDWVAVHGDPALAREMIASLPALPKGEAWVWAPAADVFERVEFRDRKTYDSGRTPKAGERLSPPKVLAPVDLERLGATMAETAERAKANDPRVLRARIAELEAIVEEDLDVMGKTGEAPKKLERDLAAARATIAELRARRPVSESTTAGIVASAGKVIETIGKLGERWESLGEQLRLWGTASAPPSADPSELPNDRLRGRRSIGEQLTEQDKARHTRLITRTPAPELGERAEPLRVATKDGDLPPGEAKVLVALVNFPNGRTNDQLSVLVGYKKTSRDSYVKRLTARGLARRVDGLVFSTPAGHAIMQGVARTLPIDQALRDDWASRLPTGERVLFEELIRAYPKSVSRADLGVAANYQKTSRDSYIKRLAARSLVITDRGAVVASPTLFEVE